MFFQLTKDSDEYFIGKATIDMSFHTQNADESFFTYFSNDVLYSITRTIHQDDLETFKETVASIEENDVKYNIIRMKSADGSYRHMIVKMSVNRQMLVRGVKYIDLVIKDIVLLEQGMLRLENIINNFRYLVSVQKDIIFEYRQSTNKFSIYSFDYNVNDIYVNEDFDYFKFRMIREQMIHQDSVEFFEAFCESVKKCVPRFSYNIETSILTFGEQMLSYIFSGFTVSDGDSESVTVLGTITAKTENDKTRNADDIFSSNIDPLTNVLSKKAITALAEDKILKNSDEVFTIMIIDIDDFKIVNEKYGHLFGDEILCVVAGVLKECFASKGSVGRISDDDFMVILEGVDEENDIRSILRAIRSNVLSRCAEKNKDIEITCSMGTVSYPKDADNYPLLYKIAEKVLNIAKEKGKNRYAIYDINKHGEVVLEEQSENQLLTVKKADRADIVSGLIIDFLINKKMSLAETLELIGKTFSLDAVNIFMGANMKLTFSWSEIKTRNNNASYIFTENYISNFSQGKIFVIDNVNILEDRQTAAYSTLSKNKVGSTIQYIIYDNEEIVGMITFDLIGHVKKWSQMDIEYMTLLGNVISSGFTNSEYNGGELNG